MVFIDSTIVVVGIRLKGDVYNLFLSLFTRVLDANSTARMSKAKLITEKGKFPIVLLKCRHIFKKPYWL